MLTENEIIINAPVERVFNLAADVLRWPEILPHYRYVNLIRDDGASRIVEMAAHRDGIPVRWTSVQEPRAAEKKIIFRHIKGFTKGMYVEWILERNADGGTRVRITHEFSPHWPLVGPVIAKYVVGGFFVHNIAGKTLRRIKELAEAGS